jgi:FkbM family methyltransferase
MNNNLITLSDEFRSYFTDTNQFKVVDIGVSGGYDEKWEVLSNKLSLLGIDPLTKEIERLRELYKDKNFETTFVDAFIGDTCLSHPENEYFLETSAFHCRKVSQIDYKKEIYNNNQETVYSQTVIKLDDLLKKMGWDDIDVLKTDTDGHEVDVLTSSENALKNCFAVYAELNFTSTVSNINPQTFSEIDSYLRKQGFRLADIDVYKYTKKEFPDYFLYDCLGQTISGPTIWGDGLYVRDLTVGYEDHWKFSITKDKLLKMAIFLEMANLPDMLVSLIVKFHKEMGISSIKDKILNELTKKYRPDFNSYSELMESFYSNPYSFMPKSRLKPPSPSFEEPAIENDVPTVHEQTLFHKIKSYIPHKLKRLVKKVMFI